LPDDDPDYQHLDRLKDKATNEGGEDEQEETELPDEVQKQIAQRWRDEGYSPRWMEENVDEITYSHSWIYDHTEGSQNA
jgi:hypothetical protein